MNSVVNKNLMHNDNNSLTLADNILISKEAHDDNLGIIFINCAKIKIRSY